VEFQKSSEHLKERQRMRPRGKGFEKLKFRGGAKKSNLLRETSKERKPRGSRRRIHRRADSKKRDEKVRRLKKKGNLDVNHRKKEATFETQRETLLRNERGSPERDLYGARSKKASARLGALGEKVPHEGRACREEKGSRKSKKRRQESKRVSREAGRKKKVGTSPLE